MGSTFGLTFTVCLPLLGVNAASTMSRGRSHPYQMEFDWCGIVNAAQASRVASLIEIADWQRETCDEK